MADTQTQKYGTILTAAGKAAIAAAVGLGTTVDITQVALGDGAGEEYYPVETQAGLRNQVYQAPPNSVSIDIDNPSRVIVETFVPENIGGWTVREAAIKTEDGTVIAIATTPATYKPLLTEGAAAGSYFKFVLEVTNASVVTLKIDPSVVMATINYVNNAVSNHASQTNVHGGTYVKTPLRLMFRNEDGRCQVEDPVADADATPKRWVEEQIGNALPQPYGENGTVLTVVDQANGVVDWRASSVAQNQSIYESSGTFTAPADGWYKITAVGGGGGGSGGFASATYGIGGSGGGSGFVISKSVYLTAGQTVPVIIGSGGSGGSPLYTTGVGQAGNGYDGGKTTFGNANEAHYVEALGGTGGIGGQSDGTSYIASASGSGLCIGTRGSYGATTTTQQLGGYPLFGYFANNKPLGYGLGGTGGAAKGSDPSPSVTTAGTAGEPGLAIIEW